MTERELRELSRRLLRLHKSLLDQERRAWEGDYGPVAAGHLLRLLLHDARFAWLRPLSSLIAEIDEAVEAPGGLSGPDADALAERARALFRPPVGDSEFTLQYHERLQRSPEVVMEHAGVMRMLGTRSAR
jgi:hypothetical protein